MERLQSIFQGGETTHDRASERTGEDSAKLSTAGNRIAIYESTIAETRAELATLTDTLRATHREQIRRKRLQARLVRTERLLERARLRVKVATVPELKPSIEVTRLEKIAADIRIGLSNLHAMRPRPSDLDKRLMEHGAKLRDCEAKIFRLRQGRLL